MNIDKKEFNTKFNHYLQIKDFRESNRYYNYSLHQDVQIIISNSLHCYSFEGKEKAVFNKADIASELLYHFLLKRDQLSLYSGNWYNILFTLFRNKINDIMRSELIKDKRDELLTTLRDSNANEYNYYYDGE